MRPNTAATADVATPQNCDARVPCIYDFTVRVDAVAMMETLLSALLVLAS